MALHQGSSLGNPLPALIPVHGSQPYSVASLGVKARSACQELYNSPTLS